jgi:hypothetical protein
MSKPYENNLNEELIDLIEAVSDATRYLVELEFMDGDVVRQRLEAYKELSEAKKALYDYYQ